MAQSPKNDPSVAADSAAQPEAPAPVAVPGVTPNAADLKDSAARLLSEAEALGARAESLLNVHEDYQQLKDKLHEVVLWLADKAGLEPTEGGGFVQKS